jgi:hypothetical protein
MPVIRHDTIGQHAHADAYHGFGQDVLKGQIICLIPKEGLTTVRPIQHVIHHIPYDYT